METAQRRRLHFRIESRLLPKRPSNMPNARMIGLSCERMSSIDKDASWRLIAGLADAPSRAETRLLFTTGSADFPSMGVRV